MQRIIITGANGAGKSHLAARMGGPVVSFDAMKLTTGWAQRPREEIDADLEEVVAGETWVLDGGPSLLAKALPRAEAVIWLDPPVWLRAWRLLRRPWRHRGRTRPELPEGNPDRVWAQYRFGWASLWADRRFREGIRAALAGHGNVQVFRCRRAGEVERALAQIKTGRNSRPA